MLDLENESSERVSAEDLYADWKQDYQPRKNAKDAVHIIFSVDEEITPQNKPRLERILRRTLQDNFDGFKYAFVLHSDTKHAHFHVLLNSYHKFLKNENSKAQKLRIDPSGLYKLRASFAANLNEAGYNYQATRKLEREIDLARKSLKKHLQTIERLKNSLPTPDMQKITGLQARIEAKKKEQDRIKAKIDKLKASGKKQRAALLFKRLRSNTAKIKDLYKALGEENKKRLVRKHKLEFLKQYASRLVGIKQSETISQFFKNIRANKAIDKLKQDLRQL